METKQYRVYICGNMHCQSRGSAALFQQLEQELWERGLDVAVEAHLGGCQDQCDYGPNMIVWPGPWRYAGLTSATVTEIVEQHLVGGELVQAYLATPEMRRRA